MHRQVVLVIRTERSQQTPLSTRPRGGTTTPVVAASVSFTEVGPGPVRVEPSVDSSTLTKPWFAIPISKQNRRFRNHCWDAKETASLTEQTCPNGASTGKSVSGTLATARSPFGWMDTQTPSHATTGAKITTSACLHLRDLPIRDRLLFTSMSNPEPAVHNCGFLLHGSNRTRQAKTSHRGKICVIIPSRSLNLD